MANWKTIESAPKDGASILVYAGGEMYVVKWIEYDSHGCWCVDDNKHGPFTLRGPSPSQWMELPEKPV